MERSERVILAELRDVERHLAEAPPHAGSGVRAQLEERGDRLRRELDAVRRRASADQDAG